MSDERKNYSNLPPGWQAIQDKSGRVYFVDHNNKTTTWVDPRTSMSSTMEQIESDRLIFHPNVAETADSASCEITNYPDLPPGWQAFQDKSGRTYFIDHNNRRTTWVDPRTSTSFLIERFLQIESDRPILHPNVADTEAAKKEEVNTDAPRIIKESERVKVDGESKRTYYTGTGATSTHFEPPSELVKKTIFPIVEKTIEFSEEEEENRKDSETIEAAEQSNFRRRTLALGPNPNLRKGPRKGLAKGPNAKLRL